MDVNEFEVDNSFKPQDDIFRFANNKTLNKHEIDNDQNVWSMAFELRKQNLKRIKDLFQEDYNQADYKKMKIFYNTAMNVDKIEKEDIAPLDPLLHLVDKIYSSADIPYFLASMVKYFVPSIYTPNSFFRLFSFYSMPDFKNANEEILFIFHGGLGLLDRDYYFDKQKNDLRKKYLNFIKQILLILNLDEETAIRGADLIFNLESELAKVTYTSVQKNNFELLYNRFFLDELEEKYSAFPWKKFLKESFTQSIPYLSLDNLEFFDKLIELLFDERYLTTWKIYFKFKLVSEFAPYLSERIYLTYFNFYEKDLLGIQIPKPRVERIINILSETISEVIGKAFVERYFSKESKDKINQMIEDLKETLNERLTQLDWMDQETKKYALKKLNAFKAKIGYPDIWNDYSALEISEQNSFLQNVLDSRKLKFKIDMKNLFQKPDDNKWEMAVYTVDAYFNPSKNEIVFPAGILQFPFFDPTANDSINYGAIGSVIGHEMTHGYDNNGRKFDSYGNLSNWWSEKDLESFNKKGKYYIDEYNALEVNGFNINGELTLGENLADIGGAVIAYYALLKNLKRKPITQKGNKWTPEQEFFLSQARTRCAKLKPEFMENIIKTDPHSPPECRTNEVFAHMKEFYDVFGVKPGDSLFRSNIEKIW